MNATAAPAQSREALVACLHAALDALEQDDDGAWRRAVDELVQWRTQPLVQGLVRLARELETTLGTGGGNGSLHEACLRLEHVVKVSEDASHHTLDLIQDCGILLGTLGGDGHDDEATVAAIRSRLSEMTAAQGYQDLTGQIIRSVMKLVDELQKALSELRELSGGVVEHAQLGERPPEGGPVIPGVTKGEVATAQTDVDALLSGLGV